MCLQSFSQSRNTAACAGIRSLSFIAARLIMRHLLRIVAIVTIPGCLGVHVNNASAQTFHERWSIIPKAHAEPAPEAPEQIQAKSARAHPNCKTADANSSSSICHLGFFRKSIVLFLSEGQNSQRSHFRSRCHDRSSPQLAIRHKSSVTDLATTKSVVVSSSTAAPAFGTAFSIFPVAPRAVWALQIAA